MVVQGCLEGIVVTKPWDDQTVERRATARITNKRSTIEPLLGSEDGAREMTGVRGARRVDRLDRPSTSPKHPPFLEPPGSALWSIAPGVTEALMLAHGFRGEMLAGLVLAGLAAVTTDTMRAGAATIRVEKYRITEIGRKALAAD